MSFQLPTVDTSNSSGAISITVNRRRSLNTATTPTWTLGQGAGLSGTKATRSKRASLSRRASQSRRGSQSTGQLGFGGAASGANKRRTSRARRSSTAGTASMVAAAAAQKLPSPVASAAGNGNASALLALAGSQPGKGAAAMAAATTPKLGSDGGAATTPKLANKGIATTPKLGTSSGAATTPKLSVSASGQAGSRSQLGKPPTPKSAAAAAAGAGAGFGAGAGAGAGAGVSSLSASTPPLATSNAGSQRQHLPQLSNRNATAAAAAAAAESPSPSTSASPGTAGDLATASTTPTSISGGSKPSSRRRSGARVDSNNPTGGRRGSASKGSMKKKRGSASTGQLASLDSSQRSRIPPSPSSAKKYAAKNAAGRDSPTVQYDELAGTDVVQVDDLDARAADDEDVSAAAAAAAFGSYRSGRGSPALSPVPDDRPQLDTNFAQLQADSPASSARSSTMSNLIGKLSKTGSRARAAFRSLRGKKARSFTTKQQLLDQHRVGVGHQFTMDAALRCAAVYKSTVWAGTREGNIAVRDLDSAEVGSTVNVPNGTFVWCLLAVGNRIWAGTQGGNVLIFNAKTRVLVKTLREHSGGIYAMVSNRLMLPVAPADLDATTASPQRRGSAIMSVNGGLVINHSAGKKQSSRTPSRRKRRGSSSAAVTVAPAAAAAPTWVPSHLVWAASGDFTISAWDHKGHFVQQYAGHSNSVRCLQLVGSHLWSGGDDHNIIVWDVMNSNHPQQVLTGHTDSVLALAFVTIETHAAAALDAEETKTESGKPVPDQAAILGADDEDADEDGRDTDLTTIVISSSVDGTVRLWNASTFACLRTLSTFAGRVTALQTMGDGQVWCSDQKGNISVLDSRKGFSQVEVLQAHAKYVTGMVRTKRVETTMLWSFSLGDNKTKIWKHVFDLTDDVTREELRASISDLQDRVSHLKVSVRAQKQETQTVQDKLEIATSMLAKEKDDHAETRRLLEELRAKLQAANEALTQEQRFERLDDATKAAMSSLKEENQSQKREIEMLQEALNAAAPKSDMVRLIDLVEGKTRQITNLTKELEVTKQELQKVRQDLARECEASLQMTSKLAKNTSATSQVHALEMELLREKRRANGDAVELQELRQKYEELDIFKLDKIARMMKHVQVQITEAHRESTSDSKYAGGPETHLRKIAGALEKSKHEINDIMSECLTQTLKMHVGVPVDGDTNGIMPDGSQLRARKDVPKYVVVMNNDEAGHHRRASGGGGGGAARRSMVDDMFDPEKLKSLPKRDASQHAINETMAN